jgi:hypothetical protein
VLPDHAITGPCDTGTGWPGRRHGVRVPQAQEASCAPRTPPRPGRAREPLVAGATRTRPASGPPAVCAERSHGCRSFADIAGLRDRRATQPGTSGEGWAPETNPAKWANLSRHNHLRHGFVASRRRTRVGVDEETSEVTSRGVG